MGTQKIKSEVYRVQKGGLIYMKGDCASSQEYCVLLRDAARIYCSQESTILIVSHQSQRESESHDRDCATGRGSDSFTVQRKNYACGNKSSE